MFQDGVSSVSLLPEEWEFHEEEEDAVKLVNLVNGCDEYKTVHENFSRTAKGTFSVLSVSIAVQLITKPSIFHFYLLLKSCLVDQSVPL